MADKVDPAEDIIDVLYKSNEEQPKKRTLNHQKHGFDYQNPPSRNYYEDLYQIQRRQFHGLDSGSVFSMKRPLTRTDSRNTSFSFSLPSQQEKMRRSMIYGSLRRNDKTFENDVVDDDFFTPESEEPGYDKWIPASRDDSSKSSDIYNSIDSGIHEVCSTATAVYQKLFKFFVI